MSHRASSSNDALHARQPAPAPERRLGRKASRSTEARHVRPRRVKHWWLVAATLVALILVVVVASAGRDRPSTDASDRSGIGEPGSLAPSRATAAAASWLMRNTDRTHPIATDSAAARALRQAGYPAQLLRPMEDAGQAALVLLTRAARADAAPAAQSVVERTLPVAVFGTGSDHTEVRQVVPATGISPVAQRSARAGTAEALLRDVRLRLTPAAWRTISRGDADLRLIAALRELVLHHDVDVPALPRTPAETRAGSPARTALVTAVDGVPVASGSPGVSALTEELAALPTHQVPTQVQLDTWHGYTVLRISYAAPSPLAPGTEM